MVQILHISETPNPLARKFHAEELITSGVALSFPDSEQAQKNPAAQALFGLPPVRSVFMLDQVTTVSVAPGTDWDEWESEIRLLLEDYLEPAVQNPLLSPVPQVDIQMPENLFALPLEAQVEHIENVLNAKVRPGLANDGGGLDLMGIDGKTIYIYYVGACGTCPSSTTGTLNYIRQVLQTCAHPEIEVELA
jgi:Fe-S cluster biogenesis protein NfuA